MVIDSHIHVVPPNLPGVGSLSPTLRLPPSVIASSLQVEMKKAKVEQVFAMGEYRCTSADPLGIRTTLEIAQFLPGLKPIGICDPVQGQDAEHMNQVELELQRGRVVALKCYLGYLHYEPAHPGYRRYFEFAGLYGVPVIFHTGDTYSPEAKLKYAHPLGVDEVAVDHRETQFIIAHLGNPWMMDAAEVIYKNLNVWADLSGLVVGSEIQPSTGDEHDALADLANRLRQAFRYAERPNRFLFGTDWPLIPISDYLQFIKQIVPQQHHDQVFADNARMLFRHATAMNS